MGFHISGWNHSWLSRWNCTIVWLSQSENNFFLRKKWLMYQETEGNKKGEWDRKLDGKNLKTLSLQLFHPSLPASHFIHISYLEMDCSIFSLFYFIFIPTIDQVTMCNVKTVTYSDKPTEYYYKLFRFSLLWFSSLHCFGSPLSTILFLTETKLLFLRKML